MNAWARDRQTDRQTDGQISYVHMSLLRMRICGQKKKKCDQFQNGGGHPAIYFMLAVPFLSIRSSNFHLLSWAGVCRYPDEKVLCKNKIRSKKRCCDFFYFSASQG